MGGELPFTLASPSALVARTGSGTSFISVMAFALVVDMSPKVAKQDVLGSLAFEEACDLSSSALSKTGAELRDYTTSSVDGAPNVVNISKG